MHTMEWSRLLDASRLMEVPRPEAEGSKAPLRDPGRTPFQTDLDRIVFSSAFRRLQDKTQVHPLADSDYVRKRLTHSIEVSSVGRSIATAIGAHVLEKNPALEKQVQAADFGYIVQAACLAHDIGNPPFGHGGEEALQEWFARTPEALAGLSDQQQADFKKFEGNAQGFRLLTRHEMYREKGGLRLTYATLGAFTKYPRAADRLKDGYIGAKKHGFFENENGFFAEVAEALGLIERAPGSWARHPLAFVMEAADDICYGVIDLEDGYHQGMLGFAETRDALDAIAGVRKDYLADLDEVDIIQRLRATAISKLIEDAVETFRASEQEILEGRFSTALVEAGKWADAHKALSILARRRIFDSRAVMARESAGFAVLQGLMDAFWPLVARWEKAGWDGSTLKGGARRLWTLAGTPKAASRYEALLCLTDHISGLTDRAALTLYQQLKGISL